MKEYAQNHGTCVLTCVGMDLDDDIEGGHQKKKEGEGIALPRSMLHKFGRIVKDLIPHNIVVSDFCGKPSDSEGMICLDVSVGSKRTSILVF